MIDGHTQQSYICLTTPTFVYLLNNTHIYFCHSPEFPFLRLQTRRMQLTH